MIIRACTIFLASAVFLAGCYGRPKLSSNSSEIASATGLQRGQPGVIVFSALWCHPCREEIDGLNQAAREFARLIQFRGLIVEGQEKGSLVSEGDVPMFKSFTGKVAEFSMRIDPRWKVFDSIHAPQGHALPTMVMVDSSLKIQRIIQQSLDYETQLRPLLLALARGEKVAPVERPKPDGEFNESVGQWLARAEVQAKPEFAVNLKSSWQVGLRKFSFTAEEMPLESGAMSFGWDGADVNTPKFASWVADSAVSFCTLDIVLNPDATVSSMSGNCRTK